MALGIGIWILRKDLRRKMVWAGLLALPVLLVQPLVSTAYVNLIGQSFWVVLLERLLVGFSFGAVSAALYETLLHKHISPSQHPLRAWLLLLVLGPILFSVLFFLLNLPFIVALIAGLIIDTILVIVLRKDLIWDLVVSGTGMGILYVGIFLFLGPYSTGDLRNFWFTDQVSGLTLFGIPAEEIIAVALFGALWGPLYVAIKDLQEVRRNDSHVVDLRPKIFIGRIIITLSFITLLWSANQFFFLPTVRGADRAVPVKLEGEVTITFNRPIRREDLEISVTPSISHQISFKNPLARTHLYRSVVITPEPYFVPNQEYFITLKHVRNIFGMGDGQYVYRLRTQSIPTISHISVADGQEEIDPCVRIVATLDQPESSAVGFEFQTEPVTDLKIEQSPDGRVYFLTPTSCFRHGTRYTLRVTRTIASELAINPETTVSVEERVFSTKRPPTITTYEPQGDSVLPTTKYIAIEFSEPMDRALLEHLRLHPNAPGAWRWDGDKRIVYDFSQMLAHATKYEVTIPKGTHSQSKTFLDENVILSFTTLGQVTVSGVSPHQNATGINELAAIALTFNQNVDHQSAESLFSIEPNISGTFAWRENVMTFKPSQPLSRDSSYRVTLKPGVKSVHGLDSTQLFTSTFTTQESVVLLSVKLDYQDKALSCEAAALKMALAYKGKAVSETDIMAIIGFDPTQRQGGVWGDPDVAFVGNINGRQNSTGYGVHWYPIASAANQLGVSAQAFSGWSVSQLAQTIASGHPVVIWGTLGSAYYDPWHTASGKLVPAWKGEHTRVVIGFKGTVDNPTHFILNDPSAGKLTWSTRTLRANWAIFGYSGVAVY